MQRVAESNRALMSGKEINIRPRKRYPAIQGFYARKHYGAFAQDSVERLYRRSFIGQRKLNVSSDHGSATMVFIKIWYALLTQS